MKMYKNFEGLCRVIRNKEAVYCQVYRKLPTKVVVGEREAYMLKINPDIGAEIFGMRIVQVNVSSLLEVGR